MNCDECGRDGLTPNRAIVVNPGDESSWSYTFCLLCHPFVFTQCDWRRYPHLFDEWCEWDDALGEWQSSKELSKRLGVSMKYVTNKASATGHLFGWPVEVRRENSRTYWYRLVNELEGVG